MASILQNIFVRALTEDHVKSLKLVMSHASLYLGVILYTAVGAKVFQWLELPQETERLTTFQALLLTKRHVFLHTLYNSSLQLSPTEYYTQVDAALAEYEEVCSEAAGAGVDLVTKEYTFNWDYIQSCFFSLTVLTTIGYGNFAAETFGGRLFCLFFGIVGIPLMLSVLADIGGLMAGLIQVTWGNNKDKLKLLAEKFHIINPRDEKLIEGEDTVQAISLEYSLMMLFGAIASLVLFLGFGAFLFTIWEDWSFFDAFYFCFVTMTTIGFGDMTPSISGADKSLYMVVVTVYILVGLAFTSTIIELVRRQYAESWKRMQELRAQIQAQLKLADTLKRISETAEKNNVDLGVNIAGDLEDLKKNLDLYKASTKGTGEFDDIDVKQLDWVEDNRKVKAFFIYESSL